MKKVKLNVVGITHSQVQDGVYALLLAEEGGNYRIPVVVGVAEAQSIAIKLQNITPPRPLSHDLMANSFRAYGIKVESVEITEFKDGVFYTEILLNDGNREVRLDSRTSDAVALALRTGAPIYTNSDLLHETGYESERTEEVSKSTIREPEVALERYAVSELQKMLKKCIANEEYERAAKIQSIIKAKTASDDEPHDKPE